MKQHRNDRSQSHSGDQQKNQQKSQQGNQRDQRAASPGTSGRDAAAQSEQRLDQEERSLVGDTARDRNVTGSTTYVTLPEQQGDENTRRDQRNAGGSRQSSGSSGRSASPRSTRSQSANDRDTPR